MKITSKSTKVLLPIVFFFISIVMPIISSAQPPPIDETDVPDTPLDGSIMLLIIAIAFGAYTLYKANRKARLSIA